MKAVVNNKLVESVNTNCLEVASTNSILIIEAYRPSARNRLKRKFRRKHIQTIFSKLITITSYPEKRQFLKRVYEPQTVTSQLKFVNLCVEL